MNKTYISSGLVYGKLWGGGFGAYPASKLEANTLKELLTIAKKDLKSGALDSGMGFDGLKGALLNITEIETQTIKGKLFQRSEYLSEFIGDLTEVEKQFLVDNDL